MLLKQDSQKKYIEFFGMWGVGKTTICKDLACYLRGNHDKVFLKREDLFLENSWFSRNLGVLTNNSVNITQLVKFFYEIKSAPYAEKYNKSTYFYLRYKFFKDSLINPYLISNHNFKFLLQDEDTLHHILGYFSPSKQDIIDVFKAKYSNLESKAEHYIIFVDLPLKIAYNRFRKRSKVVFAEKIMRNCGAKMDYALFSKIYSKYKKALAILVEEKEKFDFLEDIIQIDGNLPVKDNVKIIKNKII